MGILDRILGTDQQPPRPRAQGSAGAAAPPHGSASPDEQAVERYRYMLKTAPPETIEAAHAEAFERLTPEQRKLALCSFFSSMGGVRENNNAADDNAAASNDVDGDQGEDGDAADVGDADGDMGGDDFGGGGELDV